MLNNFGSKHFQIAADNVFNETDEINQHVDANTIPLNEKLQHIKLTSILEASISTTAKIILLDLATQADQYGRIEFSKNSLVDSCNLNLNEVNTAINELVYRKIFGIKPLELSNCDVIRFGIIRALEVIQ